MDARPAALPDDNALVIGEGVVLDLEPASVGLRIVAVLIDLVVLLVALTAAGVGLVYALAGADEAIAEAVSLVVVLGVVLGVPITVETLSRGRSLGKLALKLRVVRDDGGPVRARHAMIRGLVGFFELWLLMGGPAVVCSLANSRGKRLGDLVAGTYVLRERTGFAPVVPVLMPPELVAWAGSADIGRIPDDLAMTVRVFLTRLPQLTPPARGSLGADLAARLRPLVAPGPPPGTHPERFLAAVIAERRDRELRRYQRERQATARLRQVLHH